jgi:hypothetical protein
MNAKEMLVELNQILELKNTPEKYPHPSHEAAYKRLAELGLIDSKDEAIVDDDSWYDDDCLKFAIKVLSVLTQDKKEG